MNQSNTYLKPQYLFIWVLGFYFFNTFSVNAQVSGGKSTYAFLNLVPSARVSALGGIVIANPASDISFAFNNPATLNSITNKQIGFSYANYIGDINYGQTAFGFSLPKNINGFAGVQFIQYGKFDLTDPSGNINGQFTASEYAFKIGASKDVAKKWRVGLTTNIVQSGLFSVKSTGLLFDAGILFHDTTRQVTAALVIRNAGFQLSTYNGNSEPLPYNIQFSINKKPEHLPARIGIVFHNLQQLNIRYNDLDDEYYKQKNLLPNGETAPDDKTYVFDKIFRHVILNTELLISKNFNIRIGYNHLRKQELIIPTRSGLSGFSWGFGLKVSRFNFAYGSAAYSLAGVSNQFSIFTNLDEFKKNH